MFSQILSANSTRSHQDIASVTSRDAVVVVLKVIPMILIMTGAVFGNSLVILSVFKFRRLRTTTNYFIVSLAFADFLVALFVMPFNASKTIAGRWVFNKIMCDIFNSNDVLFSTASLLHICCISMDRYIAILHPLQYDRHMNKHRVIVLLAITWGASTLISCIPIHLGWYTTSEQLQELAGAHVCTFVVSRIYCAVSSSISFWIPCTIVVFAYHRIYKEAMKQEKQIHALLKIHKDSDASVSGSQDSNCLHAPHSVSVRNALTDIGNQGNISTSSRVQRHRVLHSSQGRRRMKREHKAAKTLGIVLGCFLLCWLPFFLWYVISTMCGEETCPVPEIVVETLFWIGYFNSSINPVIYAFFNREFRRAFRKLLCCAGSYGKHFSSQFERDWQHSSANGYRTPFGVSPTTSPSATFVKRDDRRQLVPMLPIRDVETSLITNETLPTNNNGSSFVKPQEATPIIS